MRGPRRRAGLVAALGCVCVLAACTAPAQTRASTPLPTTSSPKSAAGTVLDGAVPQSLLDLPLIDHTGRQMTLASLRGKVVVVSDIMTLCQQVCAIGTASMLQAARAVDRAGLGNRVEFLSITIDPVRDDPRHVAAYRRVFGPLQNWETLTGSPADINLLWDKVGVWRRSVPVKPPYPRDWLTQEPLTSDIQHTDDLIFINADQRFRYVIDGPGSVSSADAIPSRMFKFMDKSGHKNVRHPSPGSWSATQVQDIVHWLISDRAPR